MIITPFKNINQEKVVFLNYLKELQNYLFKSTELLKTLDSKPNSIEAIKKANTNVFNKNVGSEMFRLNISEESNYTIIFYKDSAKSGVVVLLLNKDNQEKVIYIDLNNSWGKSCH